MQNKLNSNSLEKLYLFYKKQKAAGKISQQLSCFMLFLVISKKSSQTISRVMS